MPQFCILFYANYTILVTQRGGPWPNDPPLNAEVALRTTMFFLICCRLLALHF